MRVKITHPIPELGLQAGLIYDLPAKEAQELIKKDLAFEIEHDEKKAVKK